MLALGQRKLHLDCRNQKGQHFGVLGNNHIKAYEESSLYIHVNISEDFRQLFTWGVCRGFLHNASELC